MPAPLFVEPQLVLMDDPFSALDAQTREPLGCEALRICQEAERGAPHRPLHRLRTSGRLKDGTEDRTGDRGACQNDVGQGPTRKEKKQ